MRVSLSSGYRAGFPDALTALEDIMTRKGASFIPDNLPASRLPSVTGHSDMTDAYLVTLARAHGLKLATLDKLLCDKSWAKSVTENPIG